MNACAEMDSRQTPVDNKAWLTDEKKYHAVCFSGTRTLVGDAALEAVHILLQRAGYESVLLYDMHTPLTRQEFVEWARDTDKCLFVTYKANGTPVAIIWLTEPSATGRQAFIHFSTLGLTTRETSLECCTQFCKFLGKTTKMRTNIICKGIICVRSPLQ